MSIQIVTLDPSLRRRMTGPGRIAERFAAERDRVANFNATMERAGMTPRTALWKGIVR